MCVRRAAKSSSALFRVARASGLGSVNSECGPRRARPRVSAVIAS